jgi:hypothetical protein
MTIGVCNVVSICRCRLPISLTLHNKNISWIISLKYSVSSHLEIKGSKWDYVLPCPNQTLVARTHQHTDVLDFRSTCLFDRNLRTRFSMHLHQSPVWKSIMIIWTVHTVQCCTALRHVHFIVLYLPKPWLDFERRCGEVRISPEFLSWALTPRCFAPL